MPKISVVMPAYNAEKYIKEAIDSILGQTLGDFELIVINDCSRDDTEAIIAGYDDPRIKYLKNEENLGVAKTLNKGLQVARGEYIARMDSDDIAVNDRFEKQTAYMDAHPECGICGSSLLVFGQDRPERLAPYAQDDAQIRADQLFNPAFAHPSVMLRRSILEKAGGQYNCRYEKAEDYELWHRMLQHSQGYNFAQPLLRYRHHGSQVTVTCRKELKAAVVRLHERMLREMDVTFTERQMQVFLQLCAGERSFGAEDYEAFVAGGKKLIAASRGFKKAVKNVYSSLNRVIKQTSHVGKGVYFTAAEPLRDAAHRIKKLLK